MEAVPGTEMMDHGCGDHGDDDDGRDLHEEEEDKTELQQCL